MVKQMHGSFFKADFIGDNSAVADDDKERVIFIPSSLITLQMHLIFTVNACFHKWKQIKQ